MSGTKKEKPALLLAGGRQTAEADMVRMLSRAFNQIEKPKAAYIGAANKDNIIFFERMKSLLKRAGADRVDAVKLSANKIKPEQVKNTLSRADVIFISGGEVEDGMDAIRKHRLFDFIKELFAQGKQFVGISAGTIMMGTHWMRCKKPDDYDTAELFECLGIIPEVFDTHAEDEDWIELKTVLRLLGDGARGYGIKAGGQISADSGGILENLEKTVLKYTNDNAKIILESGSLGQQTK